MKKISFDGIGAVIATFAVQDGLEGGQVAKMTANGEMGPCEAGNAFCGVALEGRGGYAAVQVKGFVEVKTSGEVGLGWVKLAADGDGGVKVDAAGGREYLVVESDSTANTAVLLL